MNKILLVVLLFHGAVLSHATATEAARGADLYLKSIKPVLRERCYACHGALKQEAGLRLDTAELIRSGGDGGSIVRVPDAGDPVLLQRVRSVDLSQRMPPEGHALTESQIADIEQWVKEGAPGPTEEAPEEDPRNHWAFRRIERPAVPENVLPHGNRNPIDAFIAQTHAARHLQAESIARPDVRLRRLYLDLTGLPPSRSELHSFLADPSETAWNQTIDRLLSSPQHGERWARHWMDIWRYSDWYGRRMVPDVWNSAPQIWRWRDWIVESLNSDSGYDRMICSMLAGDELYPEDDSAGYATGYLIRNWYALNPNDWMRNNVEHTGKAFLGLTFNCAHCHDHKYDPITQDNYFQLRAFFEPIGIRQDRVPGEADPGPFQEYEYSVLRKIVRTGSVRIFDRNPQASTWFYTGGDERNRVSDRGSMTPGVPAFLIPDAFKLDEIQLPAIAAHPGLRPTLRDSILHDFDQQIEAIEQQLAACETSTAPATTAEGSAPADSAPEISALNEMKTMGLTAQRAAIGAARSSYEARYAADLARHTGTSGADAQQLAEVAGRLEQTANVLQAEANVAAAQLKLTEAQAAPDNAEAQKVVEAATKQLEDSKAALAKAQSTAADESLKGQYTSVGPDYPQTSTGRRRALALWMTHRDHPLTARVAVNHIWMRHFHTPLVASVFDFGRNGTPPTHPELLDWLAMELIESNWSMKHIHRLIVSSNTWQLSSAPSNEKNLATDPDNRCLWRMNVGRMENEVLRDSILQCAGVLDTTLGGQELENKDALTTYRRSLYYSCNPEVDGKNPLGSLFDAPEPAECYRRTRSVVPQQALAMLNSDFVQQHSEQLSARIRTESPSASREETITAAFELILTRQPSPQELRACTQFLADETNTLDSLCRVLLNHNDFIAIR